MAWSSRTMKSTVWTTVIIEMKIDNEVKLALFLTSSHFLWSSKSSWQYARHSEWYTAANSFTKAFLLIIPITSKEPMKERKGKHKTNMRTEGLNPKRFLTGLYITTIISSMRTEGVNALWGLMQLECHELKRHGNSNYKILYYM